MKLSELFSLLDQLKVYTNCEETKITYDGNVIGFWFIWESKNLRLVSYFTENHVQSFLTMDLLIRSLTDFVNKSKLEWSQKYGKPFENSTDGQDEITK